MYYIKKKNSSGIYHGNKNGKPLFYIAFFSNCKYYKTQKNAERIIKRLRGEDYLEVIEISPITIFLKQLKRR